MTQSQTQHATHQNYILELRAQLLAPPKSLLSQAIYTTCISSGRGLMSPETFSSPLRGSAPGKKCLLPSLDQVRAEVRPGDPATVFRKLE